MKKKEEGAEFTRGRKLNISLVFITQSHFKVAKETKFYPLFYHENCK